LLWQTRDVCQSGDLRAYAEAIQHALDVRFSRSFANHKSGRLLAGALDASSAERLGQ
jgi:hypothetical protein